MICCTKKLVNYSVLGVSPCPIFQFLSLVPIICAVQVSGTATGKKPLGKSGHRWEDIIRMDLQ